MSSKKKCFAKEVRDQPLKCFGGYNDITVSYLVKDDVEKQQYPRQKSQNMYSSTSKCIITAKCVVLKNSSWKKKKSQFLTNGVFGNV